VVLLIDNYDSFVFNLARYLEELGEDVTVLRNDATDVAGIRELAPTHIVLSPGPCTPTEAGVSVTVLGELGDSTPVLGVCLGHQCIAAAFGGELVRASRPMHGVVDEIIHDETGLFAGLPAPLAVTRYHSLVVPPHACGDGVIVTATSGSGEVMAIEHRSRPIWGVQFHPEAVLTYGGHRLLANFLALGRGTDPTSVSVTAGSSPEIPGRAEAVRG
jgi:para-aminobenzoate synthetase component 2